MNYGYNLALEILKCEIPSYEQTEDKINERIDALEEINRRLDDLRHMQEMLSRAKREKKAIDYREDVNTQLIMDRIYQLDPKVFKELGTSHVISTNQIEGLMGSCEGMIKKLDMAHQQATMYLTQSFTERRSKEEIFAKNVEMEIQSGRTFINNQIVR